MTGTSHRPWGDGDNVPNNQNLQSSFLYKELGYLGLNASSEALYFTQTFQTQNFGRYRLIFFMWHS